MRILFSNILKLIRKNFKKSSKFCNDLRFWVRNYLKKNIFNGIFLHSGTLEGKRKRISYEEILERPTLKFTGVYQKDVADLMVLCKVVTKTEELSLPTTTSYKAFTNRWKYLFFFLII